MHEPASLSTYAYLLLSASLFAVWLILYGVRPDLRRQTLRISLGTMPLGLTEPLFVPAYWNPPTLLDLARRTEFDLESLLFSFAMNAQSLTTGVGSDTGGRVRVALVYALIVAVASSSRPCWRRWRCPSAR